MTHPRIDDEERESGCAGLEWHVVGGATTAVQQESVTGLTEQHGRLVHDPGGSAGEFVLGLAREPYQFRAHHREPVQISEREADGALQRCR